MREIKFRAWYPTNKRMVYEADFKGDGIYDEKAEFWKRRYLNPSYKVMQSTGLKDKNGKEIYEGDILSVYSVGQFEIFYESVAARFLARSVSGANTTKSMGYSATHGKIIGNIYENPITTPSHLSRSAEYKAMAPGFPTLDKLIDDERENTA